MRPRKCMQRYPLTAPLEPQQTTLLASASRGLALTCLVLSALAMPHSVAAKEPGGQAPERHPSRIFFEPMDVPLVSIDVVALDRSGNPVPGLTIDDFQVFEDGTPMEVSHFYAAPSVASPSSTPAAPAEPSGPVEPGQSQRLFVVVYIDETNIAPLSRASAIENLSRFFESEMPEQLSIMLATYDGSFRILQPFTRNTVALREALDGVRSGVAMSSRAAEMALIRDIERSGAYNVGALAGSPGQGTGGMAPTADAIGDIEDALAYLAQIESIARQRREHTRGTIELLRRFVRSLAGLDGRKAVFFVSDRIEINPAEHLFQVWQSTYPELAREQGVNATIEARRLNLNEELRRLVEHANTYRVSFYTMSADARNALTMISAERRGVGGGSALEIMPEASLEEAFSRMTANTGGRPLANNQALPRQLEEVAEELGSYYSIAYRPPAAGDGSYHSIRVATDRRGVSLRYREGYLASTPIDQMIDRTLSAAIHGVTDNPLGVTVSTRTVKSRDDGKYLVPLLVAVPLGQLVLLPSEATHNGEISIFVVVRDPHGGLSEVQRRQYPVQIPNEQLLAALGQSAGFTMGLIMHEGEQVVAVGVRDDLAKVESTVITGVMVGDRRPDATDEGRLGAGA